MKYRVTLQWQLKFNYMYFQSSTLKTADFAFTFSRNAAATDYNRSSGYTKPDRIPQTTANICFCSLLNIGIIHQYKGIDYH
ncbi:hypothetical protein QFZ37_003356 [Chryseobacterium ginsenosidimutans]|uniref:hypothetical protein n=1 Tax=Chryseobacterium ginsenosidimutans TaxID=687846 RepID=UPI0027846D9B|nr:hypothetical protein [Chryseobacterium ginsenosidimutans]MDQ0594987.1 hypothetical protein [Chryseobacterium ginsenosidimutans]